MRIRTLLWLSLGLPIGLTGSPAEPVNIDQVNSSSSTEEVKPGSSGSAVLRAQILLDRAHFSPAEIDGIYGENLGRAIAAYRAANGLESSSKVDAPMWQKLNADTAPVIQEYTLIPEDVSGPYSPNLPHSMMEQAKLPALNYENAMEGLGEKFHCDPKLLDALNPGKDLTQAGEKIMVPSVTVAPPAGAVMQVIVSKNRGVVQALDSDGKVLVSYPATMGSEHDPLPLGDWKVVSVQRNPYFHYNAKLFWDAKDKSEQATLKPGPNSPVGVVWIGLTKEHYGIHGTENPHTIGHTQSHGCVRLTNWDAMELAGLVAKDTPVHMVED